MNFMVKSPADQHFLPYCAGLTLQYLPEASVTSEKGKWVQRWSNKTQVRNGRRVSSSRNS